MKRFYRCLKAIFLSLFMGFLAACLTQLLTVNTDWVFISAIAGMVFISSLIFSPIIVALSLSIIAFLTQRVVLPGLDNILKVVNIQGVYQPLLTISLCLFVFAFLLDFSVS